MSRSQHRSTLKTQSPLLLSLLLAGPAQAGLLDMVTSTVSTASSGDSSASKSEKTSNSFDLTAAPQQSAAQFVEIENADKLSELVNVTSTAAKTGDIARNAVTVGSRLASAFGAGPAIDLGYGNTQDYEWQVENGTFEDVITRYYPAVAAMLTVSLTQPEKLAAR